MKVITEPKIRIETNNFTISLDNNYESDYSFLSHAHSDHLTKMNNPILCSEATSVLAKLRKYEVNRLNHELKGVKLVNSGHILGSKSLIIEEDDEKLVFTADFNTHDRGFLKGFKPIKCSTLIMESTFGKPYFIFPEFKEEIKKARDFVDDNIKKNYLTVMMGYPLGKVQELQYVFKNYTNNVHEKLEKYNKVHNDNGVNFGEKESTKKCDILFTPVMHSNNNYFNKIKRERGVKFAVFSGWNMIPSYKKRFGADKGFTISDHADFKELIKTVHESNPDKVYINHGSSEELTHYLNIEGFNAISL